MTPYRPLIEQTAKQYSLDPNLVEAIVIAESNACTDAFRYEPGFYDRYLRDSSEWRDWNPRRVSSSYGLMQVLFTTAKSYGFGDLPELLFLPDVGLKYGCLHLTKMLSFAGQDVRKALAAYNGGQGNWKGADAQKYAARVSKLYEAVKTAHP